VQAIVAQQCDDLAEARRQLGVMVRQFGPPVPGLSHGLTHLFPSAEALATGDLADLDLPPATIKSVAALAAGVASGDIVLDHGARRADLIASLTAVTGIEPATAHQIALRLGHQSRHGTSADEGRAQPLRQHRPCRGLVGGMETARPAGLLVTAFVLSGQGRGETIRRDLTAVPPELSGPSRLIRQRSFGPTATDVGSTESHKSPRPRAGQTLSLRGLSPGGGCRLGAGVVSGRTWRWRPG
jgi:hypothetical protein